MERLGALKSQEVASFVGVHLHRAHLDARRDSILQRAGYRVLGIPAALVTSDLEGAVALIRNALAT